MNTTTTNNKTQQAEPLRVSISKEEIKNTSRLYNFAADVLRVLTVINSDSRTTSEGIAYVWNRPDIDRAADALRIERTAFYNWCYDNSDFITTRVMIRAAIALHPDSPAPTEAHRLFEWQFISEKADRMAETMSRDLSGIRNRHHTERHELADGITREMESTRNAYDFHFDIRYKYYKNGQLLAMFSVTGYPGKWDHISTIRPPHAGAFSTGDRCKSWQTISEADAFILSEIKAGALQSYDRATK